MAKAKWQIPNDKYKNSQHQNGNTKMAITKMTDMKIVYTTTAKTKIPKIEIGNKQNQIANRQNGQN